MKKFTTLLFGAALVVAHVGMVAAQSNQDIMAADAIYKPVKTGDYRELGFFRKLKLGATPYFAPHQIRDISVVWQYSPYQFKDVDLAILRTKLDNGEIALMEYNPGQDNWRVSGVMAGDVDYVEMGVMGWLSKAGDIKDLSFVSYNGAAFGRDPQGSLVAWQAESFDYDGDK